jgi:hypothetical protein
MLFKLNKSAGRAVLTFCRVVDGSAFLACLSFSECYAPASGLGSSFPDH